MSLAYRLGTIAVANGGNTVTGTTTAWLNQIKQGDLALLPDGGFYEVAADAPSNTSFDIVEDYEGTTVASGGVYAIFRFSSAWRPTAELSIRIANFLASTTAIYSGSGAPDNSLGGDNSAYFRSDAPELYFKAGGVWGSPISLTGPTGPTGPTYAGTSTTSRTLNTGSMTITTQAALAWLPGARIRIASAASPSTHFMEGEVTAYNSGTGSLTFTSDYFEGTGARADWNLSLAGERGTTGAQGAGYATTSTASLLIGTGTKAFTGVATTLGYTIGQRARAASAADTTNWMEGRVTGYSGSTLTLSVDVVGGAGTFADWNINVSGSQGIQGIQGDQGDQGDQGIQGASYAATSTTSLAIGTGAKASTTQAGLAYVAGSRVRMSSAANTSNYMEGVCTAYNSGTGAITIDVAIVGGSGTFADWNFSLAGNKGEAGTSLVYVSGGYNGATTYSQGQWIKEGSASWVYINATPASGNALPVLPTTSNSYWSLLAEDGVDGTGAVDSVNGENGTVVLTATDIEIESLTPTGYTPAGTSIEQHLSGISAALLSAGINDNYLVNGDGLFNTNPLTSAADTVGIVDQWRALTQTAAISFSVVNDAVDGVPKMIRLSQANASAQRMGAAQTIEAAASKLLRGRSVTLSGKVNLSTSATVRFAILAWTGTADAAPADPIADFTSGTYTTGNFFTSTTMSLIAEGSLAVTGGAITDISLSGSVPSGANNIIVLLWTSATVIQNVTLDFRAKLETGNTSTAWTPLAPPLELARTTDFARRIQIASAGDCDLGLLTNPFFEISQENGTTLMSAIGSTPTYGVDQFFAAESGATLVFSTQNVVSPFSGTATLKRLLNSVKTIATTAQASPAAGETLQPCSQRIEGSFLKTLGWGTSDARAIDVALVVQASVTGTYMFAVRNSAFNRSYVASFNLTANTPTVVFLTIPGDTSGTWATDSSGYAQIDIGCHSGTTFQIPSLSTWTAGNYLSHASATNWQATTNAFVQVAYAQIFPSGVLPFTAASQITGEALQLLLNMRRPYDEELRRCYRYYYKHPFTQFMPFATGFCYTTTQALGTLRPPVSMRAIPTLAISAASHFSAYNSNGVDLAMTAFSQSGFSCADSVRLDATVASGLVAGNGTLFTMTNASAALAFNSRL